MIANPTVIAAIALVFLCGGAFAWSAATDGRRARLRERLEGFSPVVAEPEPVDISLRRPETGDGPGILSVALKWLDAIVATTGHQIGRLHVIVAVIAGIVGVGVFSVTIDLPGLLSLVLAIAGGLLAPAWLVRHMQFRFRQQFVDSFPDALDLIVRGVRAGLPVIGAMGVCAEEIPGPVGKEMERTLHQMHIGADMETALQAAAERIRVPDFWFFVVSLNLQRRTGGPLAETLSNLSSLIRRRKEIRIKARSLTAEARTSTIILTAIPIAVAALLFVVSGDQMNAVLADPRGRFLLGLAVALLFAGIFTMVTMVKRATR